MEQYQKFSSDEIGSPSVDLQDALASLTPILPPSAGAGHFDASLWTVRVSPPLDTPRHFRLCRAIKRYSVLWRNLAVVWTVRSVVSVVVCDCDGCR